MVGQRCQLDNLSVDAWSWRVGQALFILWLCGSHFQHHLPIQDGSSNSHHHICIPGIRKKERREKHALLPSRKLPGRCRPYFCLTHHHPELRYMVYSAASDVGWPCVQLKTRAIFLYILGSKRKDLTLGQLSISAIENKGDWVGKVISNLELY